MRSAESQVGKEGCFGFGGGRNVLLDVADELVDIELTGVFEIIGQLIQ